MAWFMNRLPLVITKREVFSSPLTDGTQRLKEAKGLGQQTCLRSSDSDRWSWDWPQWVRSFFHAKGLTSHPRCSWQSGLDSCLLWAVLCFLGREAEPLASTRYMLVVFPSCPSPDNQKCLQTSPHTLCSSCNPRSSSKFLHRTVINSE